MSTELQTETTTEAHNNGNGQLAFLVDSNVFNHLWRVGTAYSRSLLVPDQFRGKPDDCFVAVQLSMRLGVDPFMLMQNMYVVHGKPGLEAKLAIALCNSKGPFSDRIQWRSEGEGMNKSCTAFAHDRATGNLCECTVTMQQAKAEGWIDKPGSKWKTLPDLMLMYRSASWLIKTSCPEVLMGIATKDELEDIVDTTETIVNVPKIEDGRSKSDTLADRLGATETQETVAPDGEIIEPTSAETDEVATWLADIPQMDMIDNLEASKKLVAGKAWSDGNKEIVVTAINKRISDLRPKRGDRA